LTIDIDSAFKYMRTSFLWSGRLWMAIVTISVCLR